MFQRKISKVRSLFVLSIYIVISCQSCYIMSMSVLKLTKLPPVETGYIIDESRPVIPFVLKTKDSGCAASHSHPRGQFIYASSGTMRVICGQDIWTVPDSQAVWVPPCEEHEVYFPGEVTLRNLFIDPAFTDGLPDRSMVLEVSSLLRELIIKASEYTDYTEESAVYRLVTVILDEIKEARETDLRLPMGSDPRLLKVMDGLIADPSDEKKLSQWAETAGASSRTLARLFVRETGFTFYEWKKRLILQEAVARLGRGEDVTGVAFDLGYSSLSAFIKMFRQAMGAPPGRFSRRTK